MDWLRALRWPAYRRVWSVSTLQSFGYWFSNIPFQWLVAQRTDSDPLSLSLLYFCMLVPMALFALPAGVLADVLDRRRILLSAQLGAVVLGSATAALVFLDRAPAAVLMVAGFACGVVNTFCVPSSQALGANAVPAADLRSGVLVQAAGVNLSRIAGPAVAGVVILAWNAASALLAYAIVGAVTALMLLGLRGINSRATPAQAPGQAHEPVLDRIRSGFTHAREHRPAGIALLLVASTSIFGLSYQAQWPALAARVSPDPSTFLMFATIGSIGSLGGILIVALRPAGRPTVTPAALMLGVQGLIVIGLAFVPWLPGGVALPLIMGLVVVGGAMQFGIMTQCGTVIQDVVDDDHRGRVMSFYMLCWGGLLPVGGLLLGTTWHLFGAVVALAGSGLIAVTIAALVLRPGVVRSGDPATVEAPVEAPAAVPARTGEPVSVVAAATATGTA